MTHDLYCHQYICHASPEVTQSYLGIYSVLKYNIFLYLNNIICWGRNGMLLNDGADILIGVSNLISVKMYKIIKIKDDIFNSNIICYYFKE